MHMLGTMLCVILFNVYPNPSPAPNLPNDDRITFEELTDYLKVSVRL